MKSEGRIQVNLQFGKGVYVSVCARMRVRV